MSRFVRVAFATSCLAFSAVASARADGPTSAPARWYQEDSSRLPRVQIDPKLAAACPQLQSAVAIAKYVLLNGSFWTSASWRQDVDIQKARVEMAQALDDKNLSLRWNPNQVPLADLPDKGRSAGAETLDENTVQWNELACNKRSETGAITPRSTYEVARTLVHELFHVWGERHDVKTPDGLVGAGIAYDFESFLAEAPFAENVAAEMGAVRLSGTWKSDWGEVTLVAGAGGSVSGWWDQAADKRGQFTSGVYDPKSGALVLQYYESWAKLSGSATLKLTDARTLSGTWTQPNGSGSWTMRR